MAWGQEDAASGHALRPETMGQLLRGLLAAAVGVDVEGEINGARAVAQLSKLGGGEMGAQRTGSGVSDGKGRWRPGRPELLRRTSENSSEPARIALHGHVSRERRDAPVAALA